MRMKYVDVKSNKYIKSGKKINDEDPKFKIGDIVIISKYKNIFAKGYAPSWYIEAFVITILCRGHVLLVILAEKKLLELLTKNN